jgi:DMSO/TMAO reductase YedYZ molybdopterin-dependent catalytic subunit
MLTRRAWLSTAGSVLASNAALASNTSIASDVETLLRFGGAPQNLATPLQYFDRLITPSSVFFVRSHFGPPALDPARKLVIDGMVEKQLSLSAEELRRLPGASVTAVLQCAGNGRALHEPRVPGIQWTHGAMGQAIWKGVRLRDLLAKAGVQSDAAHVQLAGADLPPKPQVPAFVRSIPLARALSPETIVAYEMNGQPLSLAHGAPLRLVVPGWAGDHWVKWLTHIRVQRGEAEGFFMQTAYRMPISAVEPGAAVAPAEMRPLTTFPAKSLIVTPVEGERRSPPGEQLVKGVAFSGEAPIEAVEISSDEGKTWRRAKLEGEPGVGRWQVFRIAVPNSAPGPMSAIARALERGGRLQPEKAAWNPSGYFWNGWHRVSWEVTA